MDFFSQVDKCLLYLNDYFLQASYWSNKKHEVHGTISGPEGQVEMYLFGKWTEALYCKTDEHANRCIWRAGIYVMSLLFFY